MGIVFNPPFEDIDYKFQQMRHVGALTSECLSMIGEYIRSGICTDDINEWVITFARQHNLVCAPKNYKGFPKECCVSLNEIACHGIPDKKRIIQNGDIVSVDVTFINENGYHGDSCVTYEIGKVDIKHQDLVFVAKRALWAGIEAAKPGRPIIDIGIAVQKLVHSFKMKIADDWLGHSIGKHFHMRPMIFHTPHEDEIDSHVIMEPGMCFTIEPIVVLGKGKTKILRDEWTVKTVDKKYAAQFEHTIGITKDGNEVFTA